MLRSQISQGPGLESSHGLHIERFQRVPGGKIQPHHADLGTAGGAHRFDQLAVAATEATAPVGAAQPVAKIYPLARARPHAVAPVQLPCGFW